MVSGIVLDAATLEPQKGMLVGVHRADAPDSAFRTLRFERASKTDDMDVSLSADSKGFRIIFCSGGC